MKINKKINMNPKKYIFKIGRFSLMKYRHIIFLPKLLIYVFKKHVLQFHTPVIVVEKRKTNSKIKKIKIGKMNITTYRVD